MYVYKAITIKTNKMKKISLNFFGEKAEINMPTNMESLRKAISDQFLFSPRDAAEIVIFYVHDLGRKVIQTQKDFVEFLKSPPKELSLDISEQSHLYQENLESVIVESPKEELERLQKEHDTLVEGCSKRMKEDKEKLAWVKTQINELKKEYLEVNKEMISDFKKTSETLKPMNLRIQLLEKKLGIQIPKHYKKKKPEDSNIKRLANKAERKLNKMIQKQQFKEERKNCKMEKKLQLKSAIEYSKENKEEDPEIIKPNFQDKIVNELNNIKEYIHENILKFPGIKPTVPSITHSGVKCDGCGMCPIVGARYKCAVCEDFDYCANCEEAYSTVHQHPFIKINNPEQAPYMIKCVLNQNFPTYQKQI